MMSLHVVQGQTDVALDLDDNDKALGAWFVKLYCTYAMYALTCTGTVLYKDRFQFISVIKTATHVFPKMFLIPVVDQWHAVVAKHDEIDLLTFCILGSHV
jgi:hypothetical protein